MNPNTFPTKGNLMLAKNSLKLAKKGYELMDRKRNILIRELMELIDKANKVVVIGGGNVAMDAARSAKRMGKDTYVYYRKTFANMPANPLEVEEAIAEGVKF